MVMAFLHLSKKPNSVKVLQTLDMLFCFVGMTADADFHHQTRFLRLCSPATADIIEQSAHVSRAQAFKCSDIT